MKHKENEREQTGNPVHKRKPHSGLIVKLVLALVTIGLCAYTISALVEVNGRNIFTVNSTLGSLYANTYRYAVSYTHLVNSIVIGRQEKKEIF